MDVEKYFGSRYSGTKKFTQHDVPQANATGFGAAADDYMERGIDLNEQLIRNKPATFFFRMRSDAMKDAGILDGDILVVDRSVKAGHGDIVVAFVDGERLVKRLHNRSGRVALVAENPAYPTIDICGDMELVVWGVVIGKFKRLG